MMLLLSSSHQIVMAQDYDAMVKLIENDRENISTGARESSSYLGYSVAIDDSLAVVGSYGEARDGNGANTLGLSGAAYIYKKVGSSWVFQQKISALDRASTDSFGISVDIYGDYIVVGAPNSDLDANGSNALSNAGGAYVFKRTGSIWSQQQKLVSSDRASDDNFGGTVAISSNKIIVGAAGQDLDASGAGTALDAGGAYIFTRTGSAWVQEQKLVAGDRSSGDRFGFSVAISGVYAIIGTYLESEDASGSGTLANAGSAYIYNYSGTTWTQEQKLVASDRNANDYFGFSVAIDGSTVVVGAYQEDEDASGAATSVDAGSAYIFTRIGTTWAQQQKIVALDRGAADYFGYSVAISGDKILIGSSKEDQNSAGAGTLTDAGSAYLFKLTAGVWAQEQKLVSADRATYDNFGSSVALSSNSLIIGVPYEDEDENGLNTKSNAGSAYIFTAGPTSWTQTQKLVAYSRAVGDLFGWSVSIDGDFAVVGAIEEDEDASGSNTLSQAGAAYIFQRMAGIWEFQQKIVATDRSIGDFFGYVVSLKDDKIIVSAPYNKTNTTGGTSLLQAGSSYIFERIAGGTWSQTAKLVASDRAFADLFGWSVGISGDYAVVGAKFEDQDAAGLTTKSAAGSAYIFKKTAGVWAQQQKIVASDRSANDNFGSSVDINGDYIIIGAQFEDEDAAGLNTLASSGSAYIFKRTGINWAQEQKIVASDRADGDYFGGQVSINGELAIVGAPQQDYNEAGGASAPNAGAAYIFNRTGTIWSQQQKLVAADRASGDLFGFSVSIDGDKALVGAYAHDKDLAGGSTVADAGGAYIFTKVGSTWTQSQKIVAGDRNINDRFGYSVAISGSSLIVGAPNNNVDLLNNNYLDHAGAVYVFQNSTPLAIAPLSFSGMKKDGGNELKWEYFGNREQLRFNITRSINGIDFMSVGSLRGNAAVAEYTYLDNHVEMDNNYYRLELIDGDGVKTYSNIVLLQGRSASQSVKLMPIPATHSVSLQLFDKDLLGSNCIIVDLEGKLVYQLSLSMKNELDIRTWPSGIYIVKFANGTISKLIKQ